MGRSAKIDKLVQRDGPNCHYCLVLTIDERIPGVGGYNGPLQRTIDHVVPASHDGPEYLDNLVLSCYRCNHARGAQAYEAFATLRNLHADVISAVRARSDKAMARRKVVPRPDLPKPKKIRLSNAPLSERAGDVMHENHIRVSRGDKRVPEGQRESEGFGHFLEAVTKQPTVPDVPAAFPL